MVERDYLVYNSFSSYYAGVQEYFNQGWVMEHLEVLQNENSLHEQFVVVMKKEIKQETEQKMENEGKHIEPCPCCGGKGKLQNTLSIVCKIVCENCGAESMCCGSEAEAIERRNEVSTRNKTSQEIIKELKTNIGNIQRLGCSGAFYDGYHSAVKDVCRMLEGSNHEH